MMRLPFLKLRYYYSLLNDISGFLLNPRSSGLPAKSVKFKIYDTIGLFILKILFLIPVSILIGVIHDPENLTQSSMADRFSLPVLFLVAVFVLPLLEEVCFRLSLKFKPVYLSLSSGVFFFYLITKAVFQSKISSADVSFLIRISLAIGLAIILFVVLNLDKVKEKVGVFWRNHFRMIYYSSFISFAAIHIFNYELNLLNLVMLPLVTLPQLLTGIISGYTRVAFGFRYPMVFHMSTNLVALGLTQLPFAD